MAKLQERTRTRAVASGAAALMTASFLATGMANASPVADGPVEAGIVVQKVEGLPDDFIFGVDSSSLLSLEESGVTFMDEDGVEGNLFDLLKDGGANYARIRVWNDPYDEDGNGYGGGTVDVARATEIGKRATAAGMKVLVDFHYSDFWADPGKQYSPKAWKDMDLATRAEATYDFTYDSLTAMIAAGVDVGMVQIGNETNGGNVAGVTGWANGTKIFDAGSRAVRAVAAQTKRDIQIAVHFTNPEKAGNLINAAKQLDDADVDYDVFSTSYYAFWHGSLSNLTSVLDDVATQYGKEVMVAETSWNFTNADGDGHENTIPSGGNEEAESKYPSSVQGQATAIRDVIQAVVDVHDAKGIGAFYWEPAWVPVGPPESLDANKILWERDGSGWATSFAGEYSVDARDWYGGSSWDNQAFFDFGGKALESINTFNYVRTGAIAPLEVVSVETVRLTVTEGDPITLPEKVAVQYNDGSTAQRLVQWDEAVGWIDGPGEYRVTGTTEDGDVAIAEITVLGLNLLLNPGFEEPNTSMWLATGPGTTVRSTNDPRSGERSFHYWNAASAEMALSQKVVVDDAGEYKASAYLQGGAEGEYTAILTISVEGGESSSAAFTVSGWRNWSNPTTGTVHAEAGQTVTVTATLVMPDGAWGTVDDFSLTPVAHGPADLTELLSLISQAEALDRDAFTSDSLAVLDAALSRAHVVQDASNPSQDSVDGASSQLRAAIDALEPSGETPSATVTPVHLTVEDGEAIVLPEEVQVVASVGTVTTELVTWQDVLQFVSGPGLYEVAGVTESGLQATALITVTERGWIHNPSFEQEDLSPWSIQGVQVIDKRDAAHASESVPDGYRALKIWDESARTVLVTQQLSGLPVGTYSVSVTSQGWLSGTCESGEPTHLEVFAALPGEDGVSTPVAFGGWEEWEVNSSPKVTVGSDGVLVVGIRGCLDGNNSWGTVDLFEMTVDRAAGDTAGLDEQLAAAASINRDLYTSDSLAALDLAVARGRVVLGAAAPSQSLIDGATEEIAAALAALVLNGGETEGPTDPTDPTGGPTDPTGGPTEPTGGPTDPTGGPTDPTGGPTDPTGGPTDPSTGPSEGVDRPTGELEDTGSNAMPVAALAMAVLAGGGILIALRMRHLRFNGA